jgi:hypothetical protein
VGKDARRMTSWSTVIVLVGAISSGAGSTAFADSAGGVNVPDSTFRQGTGTQEIDVSLGGSVVGSTETLVVWPLYSSNYHWLLGVEASRSTGGSCRYDVGQWLCSPGLHPWRAGELLIQVGTSETTPTATTTTATRTRITNCGRHRGACMASEITVQVIPGPPSSFGGPPDGRPVSVSGTVVIAPPLPTVQSASATESAVVAPKVAASEPAPRTTSPAVVVSSAPSATPSAPASSGAPSSSAMSMPLTEVSPSVETSIDAQNTSQTSPTSASHGPAFGLYMLFLIPILGGVAGPLGLRYGKRRRARRTDQ